MESRRLLIVIVLALTPAAARAQGTVADYQRAMGLRGHWQNLAVGVPDTPTWVARTNRFWFRRSVKGGNEFVVADPDTKAIVTPFDHARLAEALSTAAAAKYTAVTLPFTSFTFTDNDRAIQFAMHKRFDFFTLNLLGVKPPPWKAVEPQVTRAAITTTRVPAR